MEGGGRNRHGIRITIICEQQKNNNKTPKTTTTHTHTILKGGASVAMLSVAADAAAVFVTFRLRVSAVPLQTKHW